MKNKQGLTIAALIIAIVGLSIGFAAFSNTLTISSSATVNPSDENFIVQFSKYSDSDATGELNPITPTALTSDYGENGLIPDSNKKALQNLHATFTQPGQSVTYELYVRNTGAYVAYLKELAFANATNATNGETYKHCYAATTDSNNQPISSENQATASLVTQACNGIGISVTIGTASNITPASASKSLNNQALAANGGYVQATITITYANNAAYVDGPMEVEFGDISFTASSNQGSSQGGGEPTPSPAEQSDILVGKTFSYEELESNGDIASMEFFKNITDTTLDMIDMENGEGYITVPYTYDSINHTLSVNNGSLGKSGGGSDNSLYYLVDTINGDNGEATIYVWGTAITVTKENGVYTSFAYDENNPFTLIPPTP